jgi:hypothetical protein
LRAFTLRLVIAWLRRKHPGLNSKELRRRFVAKDGGAHHRRGRPTNQQAILKPRDKVLDGLRSEVE